MRKPKLLHNISSHAKFQNDQGHLGCNSKKGIHSDKTKGQRPNESQKAMIIDVMESVGETASETWPIVYTHFGIILFYLPFRLIHYFILFSFLTFLGKLDMRIMSVHACV